MTAFILVYLVGWLVMVGILTFLEISCPSGVDGGVLFMISLSSWVGVIMFICVFLRE